MILLRLEAADREDPGAGASPKRLDLRSRPDQGRRRRDRIVDRLDAVARDSRKPRHVVGRLGRYDHARVGLRVEEPDAQTHQLRGESAERILLRQRDMIADHEPGLRAGKPMGEDPDHGQRPHRDLQRVRLLAAKIAAERQQDVADPRRVEIDDPDPGRKQRHQLAACRHQHQVDPVAAGYEVLDQSKRDPLRAAAAHVRQKEGEPLSFRPRRLGLRAHLSPRARPRLSPVGADSRNIARRDIRRGRRASRASMLRPRKVELGGRSAARMRGRGGEIFLGEIVRRRPE